VHAKPLVGVAAGLFDVNLALANGAWVAQQRVMVNVVPSESLESFSRLPADLPGGSHLGPGASQTFENLLDGTALFPGFFSGVTAENLAE
jgi:hypothetical protein